MRPEPSDLADLLRALDVGALVPGSLARYRPAVVDGIAIFLEGLAPDRRAAVLRRQAALPPETPPAGRLVALAEQCPVLHKLGQTLARDRRLPPGLRALLQGLESMPCRRDAREVAEAAEREIGPLADAGLALDGPPLAEASVAVVLPVVWRAPGGEDRRSVLKVLKPGIERALDEELGLLARVGEVLDERSERYGLPPIDYGQSFRQVRELLGREVHLDLEQAHMRAARRAYRDMPAVLVPEVLPASTPRVTAMERVDGARVTVAAARLPAGERRWLAELIVRALIARPVLSPGDGEVFHADPHAGNLLATPDGRLGVLDWSLAGRLSRRDLELVADVLVAAAMLQPARATGAVAALAGGAVNRVALDAVVDRALGRMRGRLWPDLSWLVATMDDAATAAGARFGPDLLAFRKVVLTLEGVVADVSEEVSADAVLLAAVLAELAREWPARLVASPTFRGFGTHLSTADLAALTAMAPLLAARPWLPAGGG